MIWNNRPPGLVKLCVPLVIVCSVVALRCYSFRGGSVPAHLKTIAIPLFDDQSGSGEPGLREKLTNKLIEKFRSENVLDVADKLHADSAIEGIVESLPDEPYVLTQGETVTKKKISINLKVSFQDLKLKKQIWDKQLSNFGIYDISGGAAGRSAGIDAAIDKLTEDIVNATVSGW
jgi:hypothetical protein